MAGYALIHKISWFSNQHNSQKLIQSSNQIEACSKMTESEFSANMHICTLCPLYQQILPKFGAAV